MNKTDYIYKELNKYAGSLYMDDQVSVSHPLIGSIGFVNPKQGFKLRGVSSRVWKALLNDEERFTLAPQKFISKSILDEMGAITSWDGIVSAQAAGKYDSVICEKNSLTTVSSNWSIMSKVAGNPPATAYNNIPGSSGMTQTSLGAVPLSLPASGEKKYLLNVGGSNGAGTNIVLLVDLLAANDNILATSTASQTVNTSALLRYTGGTGVYVILEVTTQLGGTAANVTLTYTNQAGTGSRSTGAQALSTGGVVRRLQPTAYGPVMLLNTTDRGVRSVESAILSASMGAGVLAVLLYKPLAVVPLFTALSWIERSSPAVAAGITELVVGTDSQLGFLTFMLLASQGSTGIQTYQIETISG